MSGQQFLLTLSCANRPGIVSAVSSCIFESKGDIHESQQFDDPETGKHFMRIVFGTDANTIDPLVFRTRFSAIADDFHMNWHLRSRSERPRVLVLVSKFDHCLADILYKWNMGDLNMELVGIVSNHPRSTYERLDFCDVPFDYLPVDPANKLTHEAAIRAIFVDRGADLVVLARYMQILSNDLAQYLDGRCINIHHSFLPGFKGARPYHQAHARGVKLIGATAHYVTAELDEGPIIEQAVERVSHADLTGDLLRKGRDIECKVLSRALALHLDGRVFLNDKKTIVFGD